MGGTILSTSGPVLLPFTRTGSNITSCYCTYLLFTMIKEYHRLHENAVGPDFSQALDVRAEICLLRGHVAMLQIVSH